MKNFDFNRFKKVVVRDFHTAYNLYGLSLLIIMLVPAMLWMLEVALGMGEGDSSPFVRMRLINFLVYLAAIIAPLKIYGSCNLQGKGNYFAMLPASLCEKFWSMLLYSFVVSPLAVFVGSCAVDTLLTILPFGPYNDFLWNADLYASPFGFPTFFGFRGVVLFYVGIVSISSIFLFTNTIFKKNKFIKTVLWLLLIGFVAMVVIAPIMIHLDWDFDWIERFAKWFEGKDERFFINLMFWLNLGFGLLFTVVMCFFTYRRLKKMQY